MLRRRRRLLPAGHRPRPRHGRGPPHAGQHVAGPGADLPTPSFSTRQPWPCGRSGPSRTTAWERRCSTEDRLSRRRPSAIEARSILIPNLRLRIIISVVALGRRNLGGPAAACCLSISLGPATPSTERIESLVGMPAKVLRLEDCANRKKTGYWRPSVTSSRRSRPLFLVVGGLNPGRSIACAPADGRPPSQGRGPFFRHRIAAGHRAQDPPRLSVGRFPRPCGGLSGRRTVRTPRPVAVSRSSAIPWGR